MSTYDKEWQRPKKPYTVTPDQSQTRSYTGGPQKAHNNFKPKPKNVVVANKNNANNKLLHVAMQENANVKITINNLLSSDKDLSSTYEGKIMSFDDFTIAIQTGQGFFLINKSAVTVLEFMKGDNNA